MSIQIDSYLNGDKPIYFVKIDGQEFTCNSLQECFKKIQRLQRKESNGQSLSA